MTKAALEQIIARCTDGAANVLGIYLDNDVSEYYVANKTNPEKVFEIGDIVELADGEYLMIKVLLQNKVTGRRDIPGVNYIPIDRIQAVLTVDNVEDKEKLDLRNIYTY